MAAVRDLHVNDTVVEKCFFLEDTPEQFDVPTKIVCCVLNSISGIVAVGGNAVIILAVWKTRSLHTPSNILFCCLAFSDFFTGLVTQPMAIVYHIAEAYAGYGKLECIAHVILDTSGFAFGAVTFLTLAAIGTERYLAVYLHLRYQTIVTNQRVLVSVVVIWITVLSFIISRFFIMDKAVNSKLSSIAVVGGVIILAFTVFLYFKIFQVIRRHQRQIQHQVNANLSYQESGVDMNKFKRKGITLAYLIAIYIVCYLPFVGSLAAFSVAQGYAGSIRSAMMMTGTVVFLNSSINPFLYCWRLTEFRQAVIRTLRR